MLGLKLEKKYYVAYEPIKAEVTISNRSGKDVVLGGPNNSSWLSFEILTRNTILSPGKRMPFFKPYVLRRGQTLTKSITLNSAYPMADYGTYRIALNVFYPPTQKFCASAQKKIEVTSASKVWSQAIGVAASPNHPTQYREYSLMTHRNQDKAQLYVRVRDQKGMKVYSTFTLGRMLAVGDPQATVDSENHLHVLHMEDVKLFTHSIVTPDGRQVSREFYKQSPSSRPTLTFDQSTGRVGVRGGYRYDPVANATNPDRVMNASELPPGLE